MPKVSEFYGIRIYQRLREHGVAHFHARYGGDEISVSIETLEILAGRLSRRQRHLVLEWAVQHQAELLANWHKAQRGEGPQQIDPPP